MAYGIKIEAYSPLARGNKLEDPTINAIAKKYGKPSAHILNWNAARGNVVLPKSLTPSRIESNLQSFDFDLSEEDIETLNALGMRTTLLDLCTSPATKRFYDMTT
ncbi:NADP-dependent oxidoreductase domain-containing protein [Trichoderma sp. TUCIM 5745]